MIVLDTNVISELMRAEPAATVLGWVARQPSASLFTTAVAQSEIYYGLALLPDGKRRQALQDAATAMFKEDFAGRVLPFDSDGAVAYAAIATSRRDAGKPIAQCDAQIAAVVRSRGARLATRNAKDFEGCGIQIEDPWTVG